MEIIYPIFSILMVGVMILRIFVLRPHKKANIILFLVMFVCTFALASASGDLPAEGLLGIVIGILFYVFIFHQLAKLRDKRQAAKKAVTAAKAPAVGPAPGPSVATSSPVAPATAQKTPPPMVEQTLTSCLRCRASLHGPKCQRCGYDHTAETVIFLCPVEPKKLQIQIKKPTSSQ